MSPTTPKPRFVTRFREMPFLLQLTFVVYILLPSVAVIFEEFVLIREIVVYPQSVPPDTWWFLLFPPLIFLPVQTIPGLIYCRPVFARLGLLILAIGSCVCIVSVTRGPVWKLGLEVAGLVGFPIYYLYFRKNVAAYFRRGRTPRARE